MHHIVITRAAYTTKHIYDLLYKIYQYYNLLKDIIFELD